MTGILKIALKSVSFYKRQVLYQVIVIFLLCAVITGSLLTGNSVRTSLKKSASSRLGNTGIVATSGNRFINPGFTATLKNKYAINCTGLFETKGSITGLNSQNSANGISIFAVQNDFFSFQGNDTLKIDTGKVAINKKLADHLGLKPDDEIIIRFPAPADIPGDAPFSPTANQTISVVLKIGAILEKENKGNFSLSINQIISENVFINIDDLQGISGKTIKINRILFDKSYKELNDVVASLRNAIEPADIGLKLRYVNATGSYELISNRVFIDSSLIRSIHKRIPSSLPVITYMANSIRSKRASTPYSFISALPQLYYPEVPPGDRIIINKWLSEDLRVSAGDSVNMFWFAPDSLNQLVEKNRFFIVDRVVNFEGKWADSTLMPEFPGIAGRESCSGWDAGVSIRMNEIREKDEAYWKKFRGTPKAFINYSTGLEMWGNNFGPATSVRFPSLMSIDSIQKQLAESFSPNVAGISLTDLYTDSINAANKSVDFGTLFLSLGFFLIVAAVVLLTFIVSSFFEVRKPHVYTFYALGFRNNRIKRILLTESMLTGLAGCIPGAFAGYLVNAILTIALNSVWRGAVQTNTLTPDFNILPVLAGFAGSFVIVTILVTILTGNYLKKLKRSEGKQVVNASFGRNLIYLISLSVVAIICFVFSFIIVPQRILLSFISGTIMLFAFLLFWRQDYLDFRRKKFSITERKNTLSRLYYSFYPSGAIAPIAFISAGIFAFFITTANRKDFGNIQNERKSGTGGYSFWAETTIPVKEDLSTKASRIKFGLDEDSLASLSFIQMKRSQGNDASCLNLNHIMAPPLLGVDAKEFISGGRFSFSKVIRNSKNLSPWSLLNERPGPTTIYGIADQTVLDWGLKLSVGDTLIMRAENGRPVNIIIAAGLQSSVFQGYVLISKKTFSELYPSVTGSSVMLADGNPAFASTYSGLLKDRFESYGIDLSRTSDRLAAFYEITNTYLSVFGVFGGLGMVIGVAGLGFVLLRNYNLRKREFGLMLATGFSFTRIRKSILSEQLRILIAGIISGIIPAVIATFPSLMSNHEIPWAYLAVMILLIFVSGFAAILVSLRSMKEKSLTEVLNRE